MNFSIDKLFRKRFRVDRHQRMHACIKICSIFKKQSNGLMKKCIIPMRDTGKILSLSASEAFDTYKCRVTVNKISIINKI